MLLQLFLIFFLIFMTGGKNYAFDILLQTYVAASLKLLGTFSAALSWRSRHVNERLYVVAVQELPPSRLPRRGKVCQSAGAAALPDAPPREVLPALLAGLGTFPEEYKIRIKLDAVPYSLGAGQHIRIPLSDVVKAELDEMEQDGLIRRVD